MKYTVYVSRTDTFMCEVEADSEAEASDIATDMEMEGNATQTNSDAEVIEVRKLGDE